MEACRPEARSIGRSDAQELQWTIETLTSCALDLVEEVRVGDMALA